MYNIHILVHIEGDTLNARFPLPIYTFLTLFDINILICRKGKLGR